MPSRLIGVRVPPNEYQIVEAFARRRNVSIQVFVRCLALRRLLDVYRNSYDKTMYEYLRQLADEANMEKVLGEYGL